MVPPQPITLNVSRETLMTIREIDELCRVIRDTTVSDRVQSALVTAVSYLTPNVPVRTMRWIVPMLRDLAVWSESYGDARCAKGLDRAADALCEHLDACTNRPG
jgi:hypothetical protein